jgi:hypothetical protein
VLHVDATPEPARCCWDSIAAIDLLTRALLPAQWKMAYTEGQTPAHIGVSGSLVRLCEKGLIMEGVDADSFDERALLYDWHERCCCEAFFAQLDARDISDNPNYDEKVLIHL